MGVQFSIFGGSGDEVETILLSGATAPSVGDKVLLTIPDSTQPQYKQFICRPFTSAYELPTTGYTGVVTGNLGADTYGNTIIKVSTVLIGSDKGFPVNNRDYGFATTIMKGSV